MERTTAKRCGDLQTNRTVILCYRLVEPKGCARCSEQASWRRPSGEAREGKRRREMGAGRRRRITPTATRSMPPRERRRLRDEPRGVDDWLEGLAQKTTGSDAGSGPDRRAQAVQRQTSRVTVAGGRPLRTTRRPPRLRGMNSSTRLAPGRNATSRLRQESHHHRSLPGVSFRGPVDPGVESKRQLEPLTQDHRVDHPSFLHKR